jgi:hypothetical protein
MTNTLIPIDLLFHDLATVRMAGVKVPETGQINSLAGAVPVVGDVVRFAGMNYKSGELALFRVVSRAHLFGGDAVHRIQLNLSLVVAHEP